jgi:hypothetical protein
MSCQQRYFKYHESVLFNPCRGCRFHWQRSGGARPYRSQRGEEHCGHGQECRVQRCEGHKKSRSYRSLYAHPIGRGNSYNSLNSPARSRASITLPASSKTRIRASYRCVPHFISVHHLNSSQIIAIRVYRFAKQCPLCYDKINPRPLSEGEWRSCHEHSKTTNRNCRVSDAIA